MENSPQLEFAEPVAITPCTYLTCFQGHTWKPVMALVECPGCNGQVLAAKMQNCPYCNDVAISMNLRVDVVPRGGGIVKRCKGERVPGESMDIKIEKQGWRDVENGKTQRGEYVSSKLQGERAQVIATDSGSNVA